MNLPISVNQEGLMNVLLNIAPVRPVFIWGAPGIGKSAGEPVGTGGYHRSPPDRRGYQRIPAPADDRQEGTLLPVPG